jgi:hypothetical protein
VSASTTGKSSPSTVAASQRSADAIKSELSQSMICFQGFEQVAAVHHRLGISEPSAKRGKNKNGGATAIGGHSDERSKQATRLPPCCG